MTAATTTTSTTTTTRRRIRPAALALVGLGVAGLGLASASQLTVNASEHVVSGVDTFAACADSVTASYDVDRAEIGTDGSLPITSVTVGEIPAACAEAGLQVALLGADGAELARESATAQEGDVTIDVTHDVTNHQVESVAVIIG